MNREKLVSFRTAQVGMPCQYFDGYSMHPAVVTNIHPGSDAVDLIAWVSVPTVSAPSIYAKAWVEMEWVTWACTGGVRGWRPIPDESEKPEGTS
jgi:hypothetical protein